MGGLQRFENRLEQMISGAFARAFRSAVQPVEISAALQREVDNNAQILSRDRRLVPNDFHVELSPGDLERLAPYDSAMAREMVDALRVHAETQGYVFPGPVALAFEPAEDLTTGRFRIRSRAQAAVTGAVTGAGAGTSGRGVTAQAVLEVNGTTHALTPPRLVVGRGTEADLRINDPGVSRRHAEFTVEQGRAEDGSPLRLAVRDLGSTNGILVDGAKVAQSPLDDGSTVQVGSTVLTVRVRTAGDGGRA